MSVESRDLKIAHNNTTLLADQAQTALIQHSRRWISTSRGPCKSNCAVTGKILDGRRPRPKLRFLLASCFWQAAAELTFAKSKADSSAPVRKPCRMEDGKPDRANCRTSMEKSAMVYCSEGNAKSSRAKLRTKNDGPSMALFAASIEHSKLVAPVALRALTVKALPANGVKPKHPSPNMNKLGSVHAKPRKKRVGSVCEK